MSLYFFQRIKKKFKCNWFFTKYFLLFTILISNSPSFAFQLETDSLAEYLNAPVIVDGKILFNVRGTSSYPAGNRADLIKSRIETVAEDLSIPANSITDVHSETHDSIFISGKFIMGVYDADALLEGVRREVLTSLIKKRIQTSIYSYRYERSTDVLLNNTFYAIGATALTLLLLFIVLWIVKRIHTTLESKLKIKIETLETRSFHMIRSEQLWVTFYKLIKTIKVLLIIIIIFVYAQYVLGLYPWTKAISVSLLGLFLKPLGDFGKSILNFIPDLAFLIVIFFIVRYFLKLIKVFFSGLEHGTIKLSGFDPDWSVPTYKILRILLVAFAVIVAYPYIPGSESDAFKGVSLFLGVLFSLGSSSLIGNLMAGYTMTYRRTFKKGDMIRVENYLGQVMETKLFVTRIRTLKNEEIVIPNSTILSNSVVNYSSLASERGLILYTTVGIGYETSWRQVEEMLIVAAGRTEGVLKEPSPYVLQKSLGDFAVTYELNVYCNDPINMIKHYTALHQNILDIFNENKVQIMTPAYEGDPQEPKVVPKDKWFIPLIGKSKSEENKK